MRTFKAFAATSAVIAVAACPAGAVSTGGSGGEDRLTENITLNSRGEPVVRCVVVTPSGVHQVPVRACEAVASQNK